MDGFLDRYHHVAKLNQDRINYLNRPISHKEIEAIKNLQTKKGPGPDGFSAEFYQISKEELIAILPKLFRKIETEGTLANPFYAATVTLVSKPHKDSTKKKNTD